jgi:hypothetical protein
MYKRKKQAMDMDRSFLLVVIGSAILEEIEKFKQTK